MSGFDATHLCYLAVTISFWILSTWAVMKMPRAWQNVMFVLAALGCSGLIFFISAMGLTWEGAINWKGVSIQMLQVCQFNMILTPLMLVPKFELARQYSAMFSMFAASTTLISTPSDWVSCAWNAPRMMSSWMFHVLAITLPMWMIAARRLKPRREYAVKVVLCVIAYFTVSFVVTYVLKVRGVLSANAGFSFVFDPGGVDLLEFLYRLIPIPYVYLYPLVPFMYAFFRLLAWAFRNYRVEPFAQAKTKKSKS